MSEILVAVSFSAVIGAISAVVHLLCRYDRPATQIFPTALITTDIMVLALIGFAGFKPPF